MRIDLLPGCRCPGMKCRPPKHAMCLKDNFGNAITDDPAARFQPLPHCLAGRKLGLGEERGGMQLGQGGGGFYCWHETLKAWTSTTDLPGARNPVANHKGRFADEQRLLFGRAARRPVLSGGSAGCRQGACREAGWDGRC